MAWLIGLRDLQWGRRRFAIGVVATALVFALGLLMSGVSASFDNEIDRTVDSFDADGWVVRANSFGPFTGPATMPSTRAASVRGAAGRPPCGSGGRAARDHRHPRTRQREPDRRRAGRRRVAAGVGPRAPAPAAPRSPTRASASRCGDRLDLNGADFRVGARRRHGMTYFAGIPTVTVSLRDAQRLGLGGRDLATAVLTRGRPATSPAGLALLGNRRREGGPRPAREPGQADDLPDPRAAVDRGGRASSARSSTCRCSSGCATWRR